MADSLDNSIRFDMFNVLGGTWDITDKKFSSMNSENAEFD